MAQATVLEVPSAVRGFHYYCATWSPRRSEELTCEREEDNPYDMFAIKVLDSKQQIVGHLPMEISRSCFFLTLRGAALSCIINDTKYYRSPIVQGGLEILCNLRVHMVPTSHNRAITAHFQTLVGKFYSEPTDEMVMGSFDEEEPKKKQKKIQTTNVADIRSFFKKK